MTLTDDALQDVDYEPSGDEKLLALISAEEQEVVAKIHQTAVQARALADRLGVLAQMRELAERLAGGASVEEAAALAPAAGQRLDLPDPEPEVPEPATYRVSSVEISVAGPLTHAEEDDVELPHEPLADEQARLEAPEEDAQAEADEIRAGMVAAPREGSVRAALSPYFAARPGQWLKLADVAEEIDVSVHAARQAIRVMVETGELEHNGKGTSARRFRCPPVAPDAAQIDASTLAAAAERQRVRDTAATSSPRPRPAEQPTMSARTRRALEDDARRKDQLLGTTPAAATHGPGTLGGQIVGLLQVNAPMSAPAIMARLGGGVSAHQLLAELRKLKADNDIRSVGTGPRIKWEVSR